MTKIDRILELLETRIARGDYAMTLFPTEHGLAEEMGVGRMTARRAILRLADKGLIFRDTSGRMSVTTERLADRPMHIGFVAATLSSASLRWQQAAEENVKAVGGHMRVVTYFHWDDPTLLEVTDSFDGIFLIPPAETLPTSLAERLLGSRARIVALGADFSPLGLRSIDTVSTRSVDALLEHLKQLGHRQISIINTQPLVPAIEERLTHWQNWMVRHSYSGELINEPEASYGDPMKRAYTVMNERLAAGHGFGGTAILCTTLPATLGIMRAANEHGLKIGQDISVCTVNDEGLARFLSPTLTSTQLIGSNLLLRDCIEWMSGGEWVGPLLKTSDDVGLFVGDSTGPAPKTSQQMEEPPSAQLSPWQNSPTGENTTREVILR
jgi:hypothetical protein